MPTLYTCPRGHSFYHTGNHRPVCLTCKGNEERLKSFRSFGGFERCCPEIYKELYIKELFVFGKDTEYLWRCPSCGKDWRATIRERVMGETCPFCTDGHGTEVKRTIPMWPDDL